MRSKRLYLLLLPLAAAGVAVPLLLRSGDGAAALADPRSIPPLVAVAQARPVTVGMRAYTGSVGARVQSGLGFRVGGKIVERLVDPGQRVVKGQPLMRIDVNDLDLALAARRNDATAARAVAMQARADERRYADLAAKGWVTRQRYEQASAALEAAEARLAAAEADARTAANSTQYALLRADADGTIVATDGEPGQVVAAGQNVVTLAHAGPREAVVSLPEGVRPEPGATAQAVLHGRGDRRWNATLRQLSDAADGPTRTFEARYVLEGDAAMAPLGTTVTLWLAEDGAAGLAEVPVGALLDDGGRAGVWLVSEDGKGVTFQPVRVERLSGESAVVAGLATGQPLVALGAHLLHEGAMIRTQIAKAGTP